MTRPIGSSTAPQAHLPAESEPIEPRESSAASLPERERVAKWSTPAASEAFGEIESAWGWGVFPDMDDIKQSLFKLGGFDLLQVMRKLEDSGQLDPVLNKLDPGERQKLINTAVKGRVLERPSPQEPLRARFELPTSFQKMVDELNALSSRQKLPEGGRFNWTGYSETAPERFARGLQNQVADLKPGDSLTLQAKGELAVGLGTKERGAITVSREKDGSYRVAGELGAEAFAKVGALRPPPGFKPEMEAGVGAAVKVEYKFPTAEAALAGALRMNPSDVASLGRPSAVELKGSAGAALLGKLEPGLATGFEAALKAEGELALRIELDRSPAEVVLTASGKCQAEGSQLAVVHPVEVGGAGWDGMVAARVELEARFPLSNPEALLASPREYLSKHGKALAAHAELKAKISSESGLQHHGKESELSVAGRGADVAQFVAAVTHQPWPSALKAIDQKLEVEIVEREVAHQHSGFKGKVDLHAVEVGGELGVERRVIDRERTVFHGSARHLWSGTP